MDVHQVGSMVPYAVRLSLPSSSTFHLPYHFPPPSPPPIPQQSRVLNARVYDVCSETPLQAAYNLSASLNNHVYLKREDTQPVFSFKIRGAYNKMAQLSNEQLDRGVVACSAGNHAQGVALSANKLGCRAVIVMPLATPEIKVKSVAKHGGGTVEVRLHGNNYDEAAAEAKRLMDEEMLTMIHPFDDPDVIAGQGTIGMEIIKQSVSRPLDAIFVCCGGGGMLAGIAAYVKRVRPDVKVIGVEAEDAAGMTESLRAGKVVTLDSVGLFADGAAVRKVGDETFRVCNVLVDDMVTVNTDQVRVKARGRVCGLKSHGWVKHRFEFSPTPFANCPHASRRFAALSSWPTTTPGSCWSPQELLGWRE